ncbi:hypothetical protein Tco_0554785 [Tanacetum coccineum]
MSAETMVHQCPLKDLTILMHNADPNYEEIDGGFVAFGGNSKGRKITGKDFKLTDESHILLRVPRKDNMYRVDLKNVIPQGGLCDNQDLSSNAISSTINAAGIKVNVVDPKTSIELLNDPNTPELEDIVYSNDDEDVGAEADMNNLDAFMLVSPILTTRIHKDHPVEQIIGDLHSAPQIRRMIKNLEEHGFFSLV